MNRSNACAAILQASLALAVFFSCPLQANPTTSLVFAGDVVLDGTLGRMILHGQDPFSFVASLLDADFRIANLESAVGTGGKPAVKRYTFRAHPRVLPVLKRHFDAVSLANNHSGDFGRDVFVQTLDTLNAAGIGRFGGGRNLREAHWPLIVERAGLRIALLGYNEFMPRMFEAEADAPGIAWSEDDQVVQDIVDARKIWHADLVVPIMHWGWEDESLSSSRQRQLAHLMVDAGATAVIGGHPHVVQEVELYRGVPIVYSVGNFAMELTDNAAQRLGWVMRFELDRDGVNALRIQAVQLDRRGVPRPTFNLPTPCWRKGQMSISACLQRPHSQR